MLLVGYVVLHTVIIFSVLLSCISVVDIDECALGEDMCHDNATCSDTEGSYDCTCNVGFSGSGFTCQGVLQWTVV